MKAVLIAGAFAVVAASIVVLVMIRSDEPLPRAPQDTAATAKVATLGSPHAMVRQYQQWAGQVDKLDAREKILDALLAAGDAQRGLKLVLEAINGDPTAIDDDPMLDVAADKLRPLWREPAIYRYGRDLMLVQPADKGRVVLAQSLVAHMRTVPESEDHEAQAHAWLTNDLVDAYYQSGAQARARIVGSARALGADDAAKLMTGAKVSDLEVVDDRAHETQRTILELRARASDPALRDVQEELRTLDAH
jgi:hypothetical protein